MNGRMVFLSMLLSLLSTSTALNTRRALLKHGGAIAAASSFGPCLPTPAARAYAGEGTMSKEEVLRIAEEKLTPFQRAISLSAATERSFTGMTTNGYAHDNKKKGTWAGAISGAPLFESGTKYESGTKCFIVDVRVARLVLIVLVRLCVGVVFGDLDSEPYSLTTLVSSAGLSSSPAAKEPPCRPGRSALGASAELRCSVWSSQ